MTDVLTREIRRALAELVDASPVRGQAPRVARRPPPRRWGLAAVAALAVAAVVAVAVPLLSADGGSGPTTVVVQPPAGPSPIGPINAPEPTFVLPAELLAGLQFVEGGSAMINPGGQQVIVLAAGDGRSARLGWQEGRCDQPSPVTTTSNGGLPRLPATTLAPSPSEAPWSGADDRTGNVRWCLDGSLSIGLYAIGLGETGARALAATVKRVAGDPADLTVSVPDGFVAARATAGGRTSKAAFTSSSGARLTVQVRGAWTTDLDLLEVDSGFGQTTRVSPGGRPGYVVRGGPVPGPRTQYLTLVYDERTIVQLSAELTDDDLLAIAASLRPADPSLAPDVSADPARCQRLGFCG